MKFTFTQDNTNLSGQEALAFFEFLNSRQATTTAFAINESFFIKNGKYKTSRENSIKLESDAIVRKQPDDSYSLSLIAAEPFAKGNYGQIFDITDTYQVTSFQVSRTESAPHVVKVIQECDPELCNLLTDDHGDTVQCDSHVPSTVIQQEGNISSKIPGLEVKPLVYDRDTHQYFLEMNKFVGKELHEIIGDQIELESNDERIFDVGTLIRLTGNLLRALSQITALGIIHRDIKPENILVDEEGNIQFIDFGLAIKLPAGVMDIEENSYVGTPGYIAPEMDGLNFKTQNPKRDVFSLGIVLAAIWRGLDEHYLKEAPPNYFSEDSDSAEAILAKLFEGLTDADKKALIDADLESSIKDLLLNMLNFDPMLRINIIQAIERFEKIEQTAIEYLESLSENKSSTEEEDCSIEESDGEDDSLFQTHDYESIDNSFSAPIAVVDQSSSHETVAPRVESAITKPHKSPRASISSTQNGVTPSMTAISAPNTLSSDTPSPIPQQPPITTLTKENDGSIAPTTSAPASGATPINNVIKSRPFLSKTKIAALVTAGLMVGAGIGTGLVFSGIFAPLGAAVLGIVFMIGIHTAAGGVLAGLFLATLALFRKTDSSPEKPTSGVSSTSAATLAALSTQPKSSDSTQASVSPPSHYSSPIAAPKPKPPQATSADMSAPETVVTL